MKIHNKVLMFLSMFLISLFITAPKGVFAEEGWLYITAGASSSLAISWLRVSRQD